MKVGVFTTIFCQGASSLAAQLWSDLRIQISEEEAQNYLNKFFETYPGVADYIRATRNFVEAFHFTYTFFGRRRRFPIAAYSRAQKARVARQAVNARIQGTSADLVQTNMVNLSRAIRPMGGRVLLTVHDSIVFQLPKGTTGVGELLDHIVIDQTREMCPWLPVEWKYDCGYGPSYGEAENAIVYPNAA